VSEASKPQGKAMYVASELDKSWLLDVQRKLHARSRTNPSYVFCKLWGLITDSRNLRIAVVRVARNRGSRTSGVDRITVESALRNGVEPFVDNLRAELRSGSFRPRPTRRVMIPKNGQPGKFRPLGVPTVKDRVVQAAVKNILEPIYEADFYPSSYGFRPGKSAHGALEHLKSLMLPRKKSNGDWGLSYQWAVEGDIKGCFDHIDHHGLMDRVRRRVDDAKTNRLLVAFLKSGVMSEDQFLRTEAGTPQGGILSPLLANIALGIIEERYERYVWPRLTPTLQCDPRKIEERAVKTRAYDRKFARVCFPLRYADDFVVLVSSPPGSDSSERGRAAAMDEKAAIASMLKDKLNLELSESKTLVTPVTDTMKFLGHHLRVRTFDGRRHCALMIPKEKTQALREHIKRHFCRGTTPRRLDERLKSLNHKLRGWAAYYRYAFGSKRVFTSIDYYVWWTIFRWIRKKHPYASVGHLFRRYGRRRARGSSIWWSEGVQTTFSLGALRTGTYKMMWQRPPDFASTPVESPVHNERCTPGSARGTRRPAAARR
jgi:RNA-directed DNA polymerase